MARRVNAQRGMIGGLAAVLWLAGCASEPGPAALAPPTTSALPGRYAHVLPFAGNTTGLTFGLPAQRSALMVLDSLASGTNDLALNLPNAGDPRDALSAPASPPPVTLPPALAASGAFERSLRRSDRQLRLVESSSRPAQLRDLAPTSSEPLQPFWVIRDFNDDQVQDARVQARLAVRGEHCDVFVDEALGTGLDPQAARMASAFDSGIYATTTRLFGLPLAPAAAGGERVALLISPAVGNNGSDATIGYFTQRDLYAPLAAAPGVDPAHSNQRLMLYLSADIVARGREEDTLGTLAHEFEHLINATHKLFGPTPAPAAEETWLDEGLAMYAMQANGYGLDSPAHVVFDHLRNFLAAPQAYSLTEWDQNPDQSAYGAAFLFVTYLVDHFGESVLQALVDAPRVGVDNVDAFARAHGTNFVGVFNGWAGANLLDGTDAPADARYRYKSLHLTGTYGGRTLEGLALAPLVLPQAGRVTLLPFSANYLLLQAPTADGTFGLDVAELARRGVDGLIVTP